MYISQREHLVGFRRIYYSSVKHICVYLYIYVFAYTYINLHMPTKAFRGLPPQFPFSGNTCVFNMYINMYIYIYIYIYECACANGSK